MATELTLLNTTATGAQAGYVLIDEIGDQIELRYSKRDFGM